MKLSPPPRWLAVISLLAFLSVARATIVIAPDFDSLVGSADYIVRAVVKSVVAEWRPIPARPGQRYIGTLVTLDVKEVIKGNPPQPLVLDFVGGRLDGKELVVVDAPAFVVGQESILFVHGNGRSIIPLVGLMHGDYPIRRNTLTGKDQVLRSDGRALYSEQEIGATESAARAAAARDPKAEPLNAADFAARIRKSPKFLHRDDLP
jgi:hypothetical protein